MNLSPQYPWGRSIERELPPPNSNNLPNRVVRIDGFAKNPHYNAQKQITGDNDIVLRFAQFLVTTIGLPKSIVDFVLFFVFPLWDLFWTFWYNQNEVVYIMRLLSIGVLPYIPVANWWFATSLYDMALFPFIFYSSILVCIIFYHYPKAMVWAFWFMEIFVLTYLFFGQGVTVDKLNVLTKPYGIQAQGLDLNNDGLVTFDEWYLEFTSAHYKSNFQRDLEAFAEQRKGFELEKDRFLYEKKMFQKQKERYDYVRGELLDYLQNYRVDFSKLEKAKKTFEDERLKFYTEQRPKVDLFSFDYFEAFCYVLSGMPANSYDLYDDQWNSITKNEWKQIHLMAYSYIDANGWSNNIEVWDEVKEDKYESYVLQMEDGIRDVPVDEENLIGDMKRFQEKYESLITDSMKLSADEFLPWIRKEENSSQGGVKDEL